MTLEPDEHASDARRETAEGSDSRDRRPAKLRRSHQEWHGLSRRHFLQATGAILGAAGAVGATAGKAMAHDSGEGECVPTQIPGFSPILKESFGGVEIPFFLPVEADPFLGVSHPVSDPSTITNFRGSVGVVEIDGVNQAENASDGELRRWAADIRFMKGWIIDRERHFKRGTFGFF